MSRYTIHKEWCHSSHDGPCVREDQPTPNAPAGAGVSDAIAKASDEISRICVGRGGTTKSGLAGRQWTMCIPVRDDDSDEIFSRLVVVCQQLQAENTSLRAALSTAEREPLLTALREAIAARDAKARQGSLGPYGFEEDEIDDLTQAVLAAAYAVAARVPSGGET